jgi:lipopolysaccharide export LptBFGC system permease protein LptF
MHGIGSPELFTALVVPIVVAIVTDVVIPYYQQKREAKLKSDKDLRKAQLKVKLKGESEKIIVLAGSTNAKKIRKVLDQLSRDVLERIE